MRRLLRRINAEISNHRGNSTVPCFQHHSVSELFRVFIALVPRSLRSHCLRITMTLLGVTGDPDVIAPPHTGKLLPDEYSSYHLIFSAFCCSINSVYVIPVFPSFVPAVPCVLKIHRWIAQGLRTWSDGFCGRRWPETQPALPLVPALQCIQRCSYPQQSH